MDGSVSKFIENHTSPDLFMLKNRPNSANASIVPVAQGPTAEREERRNMTASSQVLLIDSSLPSPPPSDCDESEFPQDDGIAAVREALKGLHCSPLSSSASHVRSPPPSDSEEGCISPKRKENSVHVNRRRPRRPLLFTFQDGPSDANGQAPPTTSIHDDTTSSPDATPFPFQPLPNTLGDGSGTPKTERTNRFKRRCMSTGTNYQSPHSIPDRYISRRGRSQDASHSFHVTKRAQELSKSEKLFRHNLTSPDPFGSPIPATEGRRRVVSSPIRNTSRVSSRAISGTNLLSLASNTLSSQNRQISTGAVWNVGGTSTTAPSTPISGIDSGRGGMIGSGTNAPMYTSRFLEKESPDQDRGRLEDRLAAALEIDQARRVLSHSQSPSRSRSSNTRASGRRTRSPKSPQRTVWKDGQWVNPVSPSRKHQIWLFFLSSLPFKSSSHGYMKG